MSHYIRLSFRHQAKPWVNTAFKEGLFADLPPMRHQGKACRALQALPLLSGDNDKQLSKATFIQTAAQNDPDKILFMDCACGKPWGQLSPFPECADWVHDYESQRWMGLCNGHDGHSFEAPLFSFWLAQALWISRENMNALPLSVSYLESGEKKPINARADLLWDWQSSSEPRLELFCLAHKLSLNPADMSFRARLSELTHSSMAEAFALLPTERFSILAGSDQALTSLLLSHEIELTTQKRILPSLLPKRL
jgi:hypothetical protein